jgi:hypothetical protein
MILSRSLAQIVVIMTLTSVMGPDEPAKAITRIGNSRTTTFQSSNSKLAESRVGNGRTINRVQPSYKISGTLVGNGLQSDSRKPLAAEKYI